MIAQTSTRRTVTRRSCTSGIGLRLFGTEYVEKNKTIKYHEPKFEMSKTSDSDEVAVKADRFIGDSLLGGRYGNKSQTIRSEEGIN